MNAANKGSIAPATLHHQLALPCGHDLVLPTEASTPYLSVIILAHQSQCERGPLLRDRSSSRSEGAPEPVLAFPRVPAPVIGGYA